MAFAIIENGGKQYMVEEGKKIRFEKMAGDAGDTISFPLVVLTSNDGKTEIGTPYIKGTTIEGEIVEQGRADKIRIVHKQSKKRMSKVRGHRQPYTEVLITKV